MSKYLELLKAIVENPEAGIDLNTSEQSLDEMAAKDNPWIKLITNEVKDHEYGEIPCEVAMPENRTLLISKVDEGLYSAFLKNSDPDSGSFGEILTKFSKMTPEAMVQAMKAKEYLPKDEPMYQEPEPEPEQKAEPETDKYSELAEALKHYSGGELHIHLHKGGK